jgi:hypothetical protein
MIFESLKDYDIEIPYDYITSMKIDTIKFTVGKSKKECDRFACTMHFTIPDSDFKYTHKILLKMNKKAAVETLNELCKQLPSKCQKETREVTINDKKLMESHYFPDEQEIMPIIIERSNYKREFSKSSENRQKTRYSTIKTKVNEDQLPLRRNKSNKQQKIPVTGSLENKNLLTRLNTGDPIITKIDEGAKPKKLSRLTTDQHKHVPKQHDKFTDQAEKISKRPVVRSFTNPYIDKPVVSKRKETKANQNLDYQPDDDIIIGLNDDSSPDTNKSSEQTVKKEKPKPDED